MKYKRGQMKDDRRQMKDDTWWWQERWHGKEKRHAGYMKDDGL